VDLGERRRPGVRVAVTLDGEPAWPVALRVMGLVSHALASPVGAETAVELDDPVDRRDHLGIVT